MKGKTGTCLWTAAISLAVVSSMQAADAVLPPRVAPAPAREPEIFYRLRRIDVRRLAAARAAALERAAAQSRAEALAHAGPQLPKAAAQPRSAPVQPMRPVSWGARPGSILAYPAAIFGQTQSPAPPSPPASSAQPA